MKPHEQTSLRQFTTLGVGGPARWLTTAKTPGDVSGAHRWAAERDVPLFVLGGGSNIVIADEGFPGLVVRIAIAGVRTTPEGRDTEVWAGAGENWDDFVARVVDLGLGGIECLSGIPGTVGGTPIQNVGAYGQEVAEVIERVSAYDCQTSRHVDIPREECGFAYRMSRFKAEQRRAQASACAVATAADQQRFIVCGVTFRFPPAPPRVAYPDLVTEIDRRGISAPTLRDVRDAVLTVRRRKGMVLDADDPDTRSVGSFFVNPIVARSDHERLAALAGGRAPGFDAGEGRVKIPAAWLIERSGLDRGHADGRVGISSKHPLAIVNRGGASTREVLRFAVKVKRAVLDWCGVWLTTEPVFVGLDDDADVEFLQKARD